MKTIGTFREYVSFKSPDPNKRDANQQFDPRDVGDYRDEFERFAGVLTGIPKEVNMEGVLDEISHTVELFADAELNAVKSDWIVVWHHSRGDRILNVVGRPRRIRVNPETLAFLCIEVE